MKTEYFTYARKSSDSEERQVLSIEAQIAELNEFAQKQNLFVKKVFTESQSAKIPGRPIFNEMMEHIKKGCAQGIIAWHPDRLARNSIDGGQIVYALDMQTITDLKFPTFWFENTPQGKFMLNIAFGQSKYYVDNLSENIKRGLRQKIRRGEFPGLAPIGYQNVANSRTISPHPIMGPLVTKLFQIYSAGNHTLKDAARLCQQAGLMSKNGKPLSRSEVSHVLSNPIYFGLFRWSGEYHQGLHEPLVSKELFDKVQDVLHLRNKPHSLNTNRFSFLGLAKCSQCGCSITAERQKGHTYYRCTKKRGPCDNAYVREESLAAQIKTVLSNIALPQAGFAFMQERLEKEGQCSRQDLAQHISKHENQRVAVTQRLDRLLDAHLNGALSQVEYLSKKEKLLNEKVAVEEKLSNLTTRATSWLEPCQTFLKAAHQAHLLAESDDFLAQKIFLKKIGSNFFLKSRRLLVDLKSPWTILSKNPQDFTALPAPRASKNLVPQKQKSRLISLGNHAAENWWR